MYVSSTSTAAGEPLPARAHQHRPQPVQHRPRGLVRADLQRPLHALRRDAVLLGGEQPERHEPHRQRRARPIEDRSRGHRRTRSTRRAPEPPIAQPPATELSAARAHEALRPPQPLQVVQAVSVGHEPRLQLAQRPRIVGPGHRSGDHTAERTSQPVRLSGYPKCRYAWLGPTASFPPRSCSSLGWQVRHSCLRTVRGSRRCGRQARIAVRGRGRR